MCLLSIAGSDSSGGAGIQADIKIASKLNINISTAITAITCQNDKKVSKISYVSSNLLIEQIKSIINSKKIKGIKISMIGNKENVKALSSFLIKNDFNNIVLDPVFFSSSGFPLIEQDAFGCLKTNLIPLVNLITPNICEAKKLSGVEIKNLDDMKVAANKIMSLGPKNVLIKGSHLKNKYIYHLLLTNKGEVFTIKNKRLDHSMRGTGCMLSSAIAVFLIKEFDMLNAIRKANKLVFFKIKSNLKKLNKY